jgi:hypothetical protein
MIRPCDAWVLRRLLVGHTLNGELEAVSTPLRRLADHLASLPSEGLQGPCDGFLAGRDDAAEIIGVLADVDPEGLLPDQGDGGVPRVPSVLSSQETSSSPGMSAGKRSRLTPPWPPLAAPGGSATAARGSGRFTRARGFWHGWNPGRSPPSETRKGGWNVPPPQALGHLGTGPTTR